eukprot:735450-Pleurochrysis_carterae.AAC.1
MPPHTNKAMNRIQQPDHNDSQRIQTASCRLARACPRSWGFVLRRDGPSPLRCQRAGRQGDKGVRQTRNSKMKILR